MLFHSEYFSRHGLQAVGYRAAVLPDDHDEDRDGAPVRVHHLPQVSANLCQPARGNINKDRGRDGGDGVQGGRLHHQAGRCRGHFLHHQPRPGT